MPHAHAVDDSENFDFIRGNPKLSRTMARQSLISISLCVLVLCRESLYVFPLESTLVSARNENGTIIIDLDNNNLTISTHPASTTQTSLVTTTDFWSSFEQINAQLQPTSHKSAAARTFVTSGDNSILDSTGFSAGSMYGRQGSSSSNSASSANSQQQQQQQSSASSSFYRIDPITGAQIDCPDQDCAPQQPPPPPPPQPNQQNPNPWAPPVSNDNSRDRYGGGGGYYPPSVPAPQQQPPQPPQPSPQRPPPSYPYGGGGGGGGGGGIGGGDNYGNDYYNTIPTVTRPPPLPVKPEICAANTPSLQDECVDSSSCIDSATTCTNISIPIRSGRNKQVQQAQVRRCVCNIEKRYPCCDHSDCQQRFGRSDLRCIPSRDCPGQEGISYCREQRVELRTGELIPQRRQRDLKEKTIVKKGDSTDANSAVIWAPDA